MDTRISPRFLGLAGLSGLVGGLGMAAWMMMYSLATGQGFLSPLNVCMASFIYRSEAQMMIDEMMRNPGMSMNAPVDAGHLAVGALLHMGFSIVTGVVFAYVLLALGREVAWIATPVGYAAGAVAGSILLYLLMMYVILPVANPLMVDATPRAAFFVGHLLFGAIFGVIAYRLLAAPTSEGALASR